jgi:arginase
VSVFNTSSEALARGTIALLGIPWDRNSSFLPGAAQGPAAIRKAIDAGSMNFCTEAGIDLAVEDCLRDMGDLTEPNDDALYDLIQTRVTELIDQGARILALGGDHSITFPILRTLGKRYDALNILHLDAHPDLYDAYDDNPSSHASPFARIMEARLAQRLVQVGIRTLNPHQQAQAERFGVEIITMQHWRPDLQLTFSGPLYLSVDLDVLDPAYAPGVSHPEPGGLTTRDVLTLIQNLKAPIVGADIVELNPSRDPLGITAMAAAKLFKEIAGAMLSNAPLHGDMLTEQ